MASRADAKAEEFASGWLTPLMFAAREGDVALARMLVAAGADINAVAGDGKTALALAAFNGNYDVASFLVDSQRRRQQGRRAAVHAALLGGRSPQHGDGAELPVDGDEGSAAAHPQAARRRRQSECAGQQHPARPHARGVPAHRLRHGADARGVCRGSRAGQAAAGPRRRSVDRVERRRDDAVGCCRPGVHSGVSPREVTGGAAGRS